MSKMPENLCFRCRHQGKGLNSDFNPDGYLVVNGIVKTRDDGQWCDWRIPLVISLMPKDESGRIITQDVSCVGPSSDECPEPQDVEWTVIGKFFHWLRLV